MIQYFSLGGSLFFMGMVLHAVYRGRLREAYALVWVFSALAMTALSVSTSLLGFIARLLGIRTPAFALLLCLLAGVLLLLFQITLVISLHNEKIRRLTQEVTLLREEVDRLGGKSAAPPEAAPPKIKAD